MIKDRLSKISFCSLRVLLFVTTTLFFSTMSWSKTVVVKGTNKTYNGQTLKLCKSVDGIIGEEGVISTSFVSDSGYFEFSFDINSVQQLFISDETQRGYLYCQPGKSYTIQIADKKDKTISEKLRPYYEKNDYLVIIDSLRRSDLNYKLLEFEDAFDFYSAKALHYGGNEDTIITSISDMERIFKDLSDEYEKKYKQYRYLLLKSQFNVLPQDKLLKELDKIGTNKDNPAFWDVFNNISYNFITNTGGTEDYHIFKAIYESGNAKMLVAHLKNRYKVTNDNLTDLLSIKIASDLSGNDAFDKRAVVNLLKNLGLHLNYDENRDILASVVKKLSAGMYGSQVPQVRATDVNDSLHTLDELKGKYVYLNFCNTRLAKTERDLKILDRIANTWPEKLVVVNLFVYDEDKDRIKRAMSLFPKSIMNFWQVEDSNSVRKEFNANSIPYYSIIDPEGKFITSKTAEPGDDVKILLLNILDNPNKIEQ